MTRNYFPEAKGNFGFGFMRLPLIGNETDIAETNKMVDTYISAGFNYFDTAHGYGEKDGDSEKAIHDCVVSRYPRESYVLTDKLTDEYFKSEADIRPFFESQLKTCGVDYFDFYLMHAQGKVNFDHFMRCRAYETALELKREGKIRHFGISFHDTAEFLDEILTKWPEIEVVQIQFNYLDYDDPAVQSKKVYDVCVKHNKPVIVMEPVKGGNLVNLPDEALDCLDSEKSPASYAIRFAAGFENMFMVLSGMSSIEQVKDNISFMREYKPLDDSETAAIARVVEIFKAQELIPCTGCRYCVAGCPKKIRIPDLFSIFNKKRIHKSWNEDFYYKDVLTLNGGKASECIKCGKCEHSCPQHLKIRELLGEVSAEFE